MIFECISDDISPQMKILNMVIPILMHFCSFVSRIGVLQAPCHPTKCDVINDSKLFPTVSQNFDVIQPDVTLEKHVH